MGLRFADEALAPWRHEDGLEEIEGDVGDGEEVGSVEEGEADVGDGEPGEVVGAEGQVFCCPDAEDDARGPWSVWRWRDGSNCRAYEAHYVFRVVVELFRLVR